MGIGALWWILLPPGVAPHGSATAIAGLSLQNVGVVLMVVGVAGLAVSFVLWSSWGASLKRWRTGVQRAVRVVEPLRIATLERLRIATMELRRVASMRPRRVATTEPRRIASMEPRRIATMEPRRVASLVPRKPRVTVWPDPDARDRVDHAA